MRMNIVRAANVAVEPVKRVVLLHKIALQGNAGVLDDDRRLVIDGSLDRIGNVDSPEQLQCSVIVVDRVPHGWFVAAIVGIHFLQCDGGT